MVKFKTSEGDKSERRKLKKFAEKGWNETKNLRLLLLHERKSFYEVFHFIIAEFRGKVMIQKVEQLK